MSKRYNYSSKASFLKKLKNLINDGAGVDDLEVYTPFHIHEAEELLKPKKSMLKFFTLFGAISGFILSFSFMVFTVIDWPLIVGGKPAVAIPAFVIVAFECTILFGGIISFIGFLHLAKLPNLKNIKNPFENDNRFTIIDNRGSEE